MKPGAIIAAVLAVSGIGLGVYAFVVSASPYVSAREAAQMPGQRVHVAGDIDHASARNANGVFSFVIVDDNGDPLTIEFHGLKPSNFESAPRASVEGSYEDGKFVAKRVATQCPSKYEVEEADYITAR